jgi:hypothetical protein
MTDIFAISVVNTRNLQNLFYINYIKPDFYIILNSTL